MSAETRPRDVVERAICCVEQGDRDAWLDLFAPDAVLEDPVGLAPRRQGTDQLAEFWDSAIAGVEEVHLEARRVHEAPGEAIVFADASVRAPGGGHASYDLAVLSAAD